MPLGTILECIQSLKLLKPYFKKNKFYVTILLVLFIQWIVHNIWNTLIVFPILFPWQVLSLPLFYRSPPQITGRRMCLAPMPHPPTTPTGRWKGQYPHTSLWSLIRFMRYIRKIWMIYKCTLWFSFSYYMCTVNIAIMKHLGFFLIFHNHDLIFSDRFLIQF